MTAHKLEALGPALRMTPFKRVPVWLIVAGGYACACCLALAFGFDHISDDDYARVTIAQAFAQRPRIDPSRTSWLPFPFWTLGSAMALFGRSLTVARIASIVFSSLGALLPYFAMRKTGATKLGALLCVGFALLSPWSVWLGASTVPESFTASASAAAAIAICAKDISARARVGFALALLAACLSRYEPWPIALVLASLVAFRALKRKTLALSVTALLVALGPAVWVAWNAHSHGDPLHFLVRVSEFKRSHAGGTSAGLAAWLLYPRLLLVTRPDVAIATLCAIVLAWRTHQWQRLRTRWAVPLVCAFAQVLFLAYGYAHDGAPTHHPERALLGTTFIMAAFSADILVEAVPRAESRVGPWVAFALVFVAWAFTSRRAYENVPGRSAAEDRAPQLARGAQLQREARGGFAVEPCAYEHFALIAAYGAPERVEIRPSRNAAVLPSCPLVEHRW